LLISNYKSGDKVNYYRYDTHVHTAEVSPCGHLSAEQVIELYKNAGYAGIIITDHYYAATVDRPGLGWQEAAEYFLSGYRKAAEAGRREGLDVLLGMELRFDNTNEDYLVFGLDEEFIYEHPYLNRYTLETFRRLTEQEDILIFQAHPFRKGLSPSDSRLIDGIEAFNGNPRHDSYNDKAYSYGLSNGLLLLAGSDAHQIVDIGRCGIGITDRVHSIQEFVSWIKSGKSIDLIHKVT